MAVEGWPVEVLGLVFLGVGVLLLLSLVSYTPGDLPIRFPFTDWALLNDFALGMEANRPRHNLIGPVGAVLGFGQMQHSAAGVEGVHLLHRHLTVLEIVTKDHVAVLRIVWPEQVELFAVALGDLFCAQFKAVCH